MAEKCELINEQILDHGYGVYTILLWGEKGAGELIAQIRKDNPRSSIEICKESEDKIVLVLND